MIVENFAIPFVIGFLIKDGQILMIKRKKQPWLNKWNGVGGKIEEGETPKEAIRREIHEETSFILENAKETRFVGIVTWDLEKKETKTSGMFAYISLLSDQQKSWPEERSIQEGILAWKPVDWVCDKNNPEVADNVPHFLSAMLSATTPMQYHCVFKNNLLKNIQRGPLPKAVFSYTF